MNTGEISCPVCSLYLRQGITLKSHLDTHPKEKVIEALLRVSGGSSAPVPTVQTQIAANVNAYIPSQSFTTSGTTYMSPNQQYVNHPAQMTTAVTYQHFMTSNGSTILPQYIQVPTIVTPNQIPLLQNQPINYVPSQNGAFSQTLYNPLYNPYIPQPYPMTQPVITNFIENPQPSITNTQNVASHISVISNSSTGLETSTGLASQAQQCTIATNTGSICEDMEFSDCKSDLSAPSSPELGLQVLPIRNKAISAAESKLRKLAITSSNALTISKVSSKTSVITKVKPKLLSKPMRTYASSSSSSSRSSLISPPPLTMIDRSRSSSISCSLSPPPLTLAPGYKLPNFCSQEKLNGYNDIKNENDENDENDDDDAADENDAIGIDKVAEYLKKQQTNVQNSVIVESTRTSSPAWSIGMNLQLANQHTKHQDFNQTGSYAVSEHSIHRESDQCSSTGRTSPEDFLGDEKQEPHKVESVIQGYEDFKEDELELGEESKIIIADVNSHDIPTEISSANIERNCDGSEIFIQEENIPFSDHGEDGQRGKITKSEFIDVNQVSKTLGNLDETSKYDFYDEEYPNEPSYVNNSITPALEESERCRDALSASPKYTDLQPATYTDLQPASGPQVLRNIGISNDASLKDFIEIDGIQIFLANNNPGRVPLEPTAKFTEKPGPPNVHNYFSAFGSKEGGVVNSVIQLVQGAEPNKAGSVDNSVATATATTSHTPKKSTDEQTPLTLNIQADESMPARGELSEQESLGADNSSWGHFQAYEGAPHWVSVPQGMSSPIVAVDVRTNKKSFKCSLCNATFSCPKERRVHKNAVHMDEIGQGRPTKQAAGLSRRRSKSYKCIHCNDCFGCLKERRAHIVSAHPAFDKISTLIEQPIKAEATEVRDRDVMNLFATVRESADSTVKREGDATVKNENQVGDPIGVLPPLTAPKRTIFCPPKRCGKCGLGLSSLRKLRVHMKEAHGDVKFQCGTCSVIFDEENDYNHHLRIHPLVCNQCGKSFYRKSNLGFHMKRHLDIKPFECSVCPKSFITRQKLEEHLNGHSGNRPLKCHLCNRTFGRHSNLVQHRNMHHLKMKKKTKDYVCRCGEVFHSLRKLEWHKEVHDPKPKTCPFCVQKFIHSASVTRHVRRTHMPDYLPGDNREYENVQCPICERIYLRSSLMVHMRVHNGEKPYICKICSKRFSTKWNLELHNWTHQSRSNMPFKCSFCKSAFFRESDYIAHVNSHKNFKPFVCNVCGQKFIRKYNCLRHQEEHRKEKRFSCSVVGCDKSFHRSYYLKDHMKVHTGVRPHTCHVCGKASSTKSNHNKHVRIHDTREPVNTEN